MLPVMSRSFRRAREKAMTKRSTFARCAYCGAPFLLAEGQIYSWRVGRDRYACNELCAEAVEDTSLERRGSGSRVAEADGCDVTAEPRTAIAPCDRSRRTTATISSRPHAI